METYSFSPFSMEASQEQCNDELDKIYFNTMIIYTGAYSRR